ncbi:hypothetical protein [Sinomonas humi]|uniref:Uncharacterized protein n=1 Tax=Sinomonas humi TaxID=1338436 RepID=A0A0B2AEB8_9MICC|nr:hypothetical protein [Sinomonas humi]KHL01595.1 hypothetical protein LK10_15205 [Sinomonas humi]
MIRASKNRDSSERLALPDSLMTTAGFLLLPAALLGYDIWLAVTGAAAGMSLLAGVAGILCMVSAVSLGIASLVIRRRRLAVVATRDSRGEYKDHDPDSFPKPPLLGGGGGLGGMPRI